METTSKLRPGQKFAPEAFGHLDGAAYAFPEPALLVVNPNRILQIVDIANVPFVRPELDTLPGGPSFMIEKNYPIRGEHR